MNNTATEKNYRVLARKYRPQNFSDLIGQEPLVRTLTNAFDKSRIAQAWMLTGVRGVGKTTTARILARALNYETESNNTPTIQLENFGEHCQAIMEGRHVDVIEMDAASHTGIDDIREIIEQVRYRPVAARYKVYIIDEVHMLSTQAFNGLLKTLEEPPPHVKFIFATTEIRKVPITILSRCQRFDLRRIESGELARHLKKIANAENIEAEDEALAMIARAGEGSVRDALSILDQAIAHGNDKVDAQAVRMMLGLADRSRIIDLFEHIMKGEIAPALNEFKTQYDAGAEPSVVLNDLANFNHLVTRLRFTPELADDESLAEDERKRGLAFSQQLSIRVLSRNWQMLLKGIYEVDMATRPIQAAEMLLIRLAYAADLPTLDEALQAVVSEHKNNTKPAIQADNSAHNGASKQQQTAAASPQQLKAPHSAPRRETAHDSTATTPPQGHKASDNMPSLAASSDQPSTAHSHQANSNLAHATAQAKELSPDTALAMPAIDETKATTSHASHRLPTREKNVKKNSEIHSIDDMIRIADEKREINFKILLKEYVRPVTFKPGHIEIEKTDDAPRELPSEMAKMLRQWTGQRWHITTVNEGGGMTAQEKEAEAHNLLLSNAESDPDVQHVLKNFPGAKVVDVRLKQNESAEQDAINAHAELSESENDNHHHEHVMNLRSDNNA